MKNTLFYLRRVVTDFFFSLSWLLKGFILLDVVLCAFITALGRRQAGRSLELEAYNVTIVRPCLKKKEKKKGH